MIAHVAELKKGEVETTKGCGEGQWGGQRGL